MRVLTTLSLGIVLGLMTACDAGGAVDSQAAEPQDVVIKQVKTQKPAQKKAQETLTQRKPIAISEVSSSTQGISYKKQKISLTNWVMRPNESSIVFKGKQTGDDFSGEFKSFTADILFVPESLKVSNIRAVIDMSSFDAGSKDRNEALPGKEWFSVEEFPKGVFAAHDFTAVGDDSYEAKGHLTIRDITLPVTLPYDLDLSEEGVANMTGSLEIDRSDFGVGQGAWAKGEWVDLKVGIDVVIVADKRF